MMGIMGKEVQRIARVYDYSLPTSQCNQVEKHSAVIEIRIFLVFAIICRIWNSFQFARYPVIHVNATGFIGMLAY